MKQVWQSKDGKKTGTKAEVEVYEREYLIAEDAAFNRLKQTYWFKNHNKYSLDTKGLWHVRGEDPNCDLGGAHHKPSLGFYTGTLEQVLRKAVMLPQFWQWGAGGTVEKVEINVA